MEREIKFRVWNGQNMVYDVMVGKFGVFYVNPDNNGIDINDSASLSSLNTKYPDNIPLMGFTGLKDKNSTEIYKGDIIQYCDDSPCAANYIIKYNEEEGRFYAKNTGFEGDDVLLHELNYNYIRVIGNVFDNYELI